MNTLRVICLLFLLSAPLFAQGFSSYCFHIVRLDHLTEDGHDIRFAKPVEIRLPNYDFEMLRAGLQGEVELSFRISTDGRTTDIKLERATRKEFGDAAFAAVSAWTFDPVGDSDTRISGVMRCKFSFKDEE